MSLHNTALVVFSRVIDARIFTGNMNTRKSLAILGGGPAGLCVHYVGRLLDLDRVLFEATDSLGGNCSTVSFGDWKFDTGAHRLHDKDVEVTKWARELLGPELQEISAPSQIFRDGRFTDFPLSPLNLLISLGVVNFVRACFQVLTSRLKKADVSSFQSFAIHQYGELVATRFLLEYSEKLWGIPASELSPLVAGSRLKGLDLKTFVLESFRGKSKKTKHLDGAFYYPKQGIGQIFDCIVQQLPSDEVKLQARVTKIRHNGTRISAIEINHDEWHQVDEVVSSLPLSVLIRNLDPPAPPHVTEAISSIQFRHVVLLMFCLNRERVNGNASMYFPSKDDPFTRVYEPRNRSHHMSPKGMTSLAAEVPTHSLNFDDDSLHTLMKNVEEKLISCGFFEPHEVLDRHVKLLPNAYPVLTLEHDKHAEVALNYLKTLTNLHVTGRNGLVQYTHIHDHMRNAMDWLESKSCEFNAKS